MSEKRYELFEAGPYRTLLPGEERLLKSVEGVSPVWVDGFGKMSESDMVICRREVRDGLSASDEVRQLREKLEAAKAEHKQAVEAGLKACEEARQLREQVDARADSMDSLRSRISGLMDEIDKLKSRLEEMQTAKANLGFVVQNLHSAIGSLIQA